MANNNKSSKKTIPKEVLLFVSFICLIFVSMLGADFSSSALFVKILNIILVVVLTGIGFISAIMSLIGSIKDSSKIMTILNASVLLIYLVLTMKIIYSA